MVPDISTGISRVPAYSGGVPLIFRFAYGALTRCGPTFQTVPPASDSLLDAPITPAHALRHRRFGLLPVRSPLLGNRCYFLFLRVLRCFSSPRSPLRYPRNVGIAPDGLPHSDIRGSRCICHSPRLFAACHVLLRLREPRHPPCALLRSVLSSLRI